MSTIEAPAEAAVRRYFDGEAQRFDAIYHSQKGLADRVIDRLFRGVVQRRFRLAFEVCGDVQGKKVLDVGCGSGRYAVEFARRGAEVVGIDMAESMVVMARQAANTAGVADRCRFEAKEFLDWCEPYHFDISLGIGFFDYTPRPELSLSRIREITRERAIFSFPIRWRLRTPTRWMRLKAHGCPVFFYDRRDVERLLSESGWNRFDVQGLGRDYFVHAQ
ncbi:MAG: methyltransferase domain-containing protein [Candidatus Latescibacterota bacterium]|nr:methyltransferase domain-containing protein [Candidatus Latescibacterota bacterium]